MYYYLVSKVINNKRVITMANIQLELSCIMDDEKKHFGGDQHWYKAKWHSVSGCGPTVAATILAHLAEYKESCRALYKYNFPLQKEEFVRHMGEVREFVKPGINGLTSKTYFACEVKRFAESRGVNLKTDLVSKKIDADKAYERVKHSIDKGLPLALLILKNPEPEIEEFTWHWMVVIGYKEEKRQIVMTTWGKIFDLDFDKVWNQSGRYSSGLVCIIPEEVTACS